MSEKQEKVPTRRRNFIQYSVRISFLNWQWLWNVNTNCGLHFALDEITRFFTQVFQACLCDCFLEFSITSNLCGDFCGKGTIKEIFILKDLHVRKKKNTFQMTVVLSQRCLSARLNCSSLAVTQAWWEDFFQAQQMKGPGSAPSAAAGIAFSSEAPSQEPHVPVPKQRASPEGSTISLFIVKADFNHFS